jgi:hypothetical protein
MRRKLSGFDQSPHRRLRQPQPPRNLLYAYRVQVKFNPIRTIRLADEPRRLTQGQLCIRREPHDILSRRVLDHITNWTLYKPGLLMLKWRGQSNSRRDQPSKPLTQHRAATQQKKSARRFHLADLKFPSWGIWTQAFSLQPCGHFQYPRGSLPPL